MHKVIYYDDEAGVSNRNGERYKRKLERNQKLQIELRFPPHDLSDLPTDVPDCYLIDLDLKTAPPTGAGIPVSYYGSTLASELRMREPNCPIILITRPGIVITEKWMQQLLERSIDFDDIINKDEVDTELNAQLNKIIGLIAGHQQLRDANKQDWHELLQLLGAHEDEESVLREASPPLEGKKWYVPSISRWIRNVLLKYPGILYDDLHASVRLGIDIVSFMDERLQAYLSPARYDGIFNVSHQRWWHGRLLNQAQMLMSKHGIDGTILENFAEAFKLETGIQLSPSICISDQSAFADWVCYIYRQPVKSENSIPYYPDDRAAVMDQARVSLRAIKDHPDFDEALVDAQSIDLVKEVWGLS